MKEIFIETTDSRISCWTANIKNINREAIVYIPGLLGKGEEVENFSSIFSEHYLVGLSMRGRGNSSCKSTARFTIESHAEDIKIVLNSLKLKNYVIVSHSIGSVYATASLPLLVKSPKSILIGDQSLKLKPLESGWAEYIMENFKDKITNIKNDLLKKIETDSQECNLYPQLKNYKGKKFVLIPEFSSPIGGLTTYDREKYLESNTEVIKIKNSNHFMMQSNPKCYFETIKNLVGDL